MKRHFLNIIVGVGSALLIGTQAAAQSSTDYRIPWFTFGAGGGASTADDYTSIGTIGHLECTTAAAGPYMLTSGFWSDGEGEPQPADLKLSINQARGRLIITWEGCGILEEADAVPGTWTPITGATSPYGVAISGHRKFYRLRRCER